ncbi:MAG: phosphoribosyltransferase [Nitrososphaeria archaeon]|nr:phosphoribosyltransferase [Nitrososphaeria archaeon]
MSSDIEFEVPSWDQIYELLLRLAEKIGRDRFHPDVILGICRGGWPPARVMSDLLENPELANVKVEFYIGISEVKSKPVITQPVSTSMENKRVLIMDDVADTGESLVLVKEDVNKHGAKEIKIATIYFKPWSKITPDYYEKETKCWVVFPWERKETVRSLVKKCIKENRPVKEAKARLVKGGFDPRLAARFIREVVGEESG